MQVKKQKHAQIIIDLGKLEDPGRISCRRGHWLLFRLCSLEVWDSARKLGICTTWWLVACCRQARTSWLDFTPYSTSHNSSALIFTSDLYSNASSLRNYSLSEIACPVHQGCSSFKIRHRSWLKHHQEEQKPAASHNLSTRGQMHQTWHLHCLQCPDLQPFLGCHICRV